LNKPVWKFAVLFILSLFISCKSVPDIPDPVLGESAYIPLEPGALAYVFADVQKARPILDLVQIRGVNEKQSKEMLDRTKSAVAALYPPESGRRFQLTAWGSYPGIRADMAFGADRSWKKRRSAAEKLSYWYSAKDGLSVALNAQQAFVAASADDVPREPFSTAPGIGAPDDFGEFRRGSLISCWLETPGPLVNRVLGAAQIPLQIPAERIFVSILPATEQADAGGGEAAENRPYETLLRFQFSSVTQARSLVMLFTLAGAFIEGGMLDESGPAALAAVLFANPPVQDGANLNIKTAALTGKEIALLFNLFSLY
jgi:hypothetical protein